MKDRPTHPTPVGEAIKAYFRRVGLLKRIGQAGVVEEWATLVGPQIAKVTAADSVTPNGVLRVRVASAAWAAELSLMTPQILARLNTGRTGRITTIRWMAGGIE